ncbi:MAG: right-handed parallel beta-helix repeat-containing protein [Candidatus Thorarchaeota archaeon]
MVINGSEYGQIILFKCTNTSIQNGTFVKTTSGISTLYSSQTQIDDCSFIDCTSGVMTYGSSFHELQNCNFTLCGIHTKGAWSSLTVEDCLVNEKPLTLLKHQDNISLNCNDHGQIIAYASDNLLISGGLISDATVGITLGHSENGTIEYSDLSSNSVKGIYLANNVDCQVRFCNLTENEIGLYMVPTENNHITNNTISLNAIGVRTFCTTNYFYYNTFYDNSRYNAFEGDSANTWDDGTSMGNWWDDYSGVGVYYVEFDYVCFDYCGPVE